MEVKTARFIISNTSLKKLPEANLPEYAFVGRSNVGKSSLINRICNRKNLAKTSSTPGKTRLINHFLINESWYLTDLPGYGYAKVSKRERATFLGMICDYVEQRTNLLNVFVLIDSRIKPQQIDLEFLEFLGIRRIPFTIVFTKIDKINQKERNKNFKMYKHILKQTWQTLPPIIYSSAVSGRGVKEILTFIEETNPIFKARI